MTEIDKERLERAARIYKTNKEASEALRISGETFSAACKEHDIETPYFRKLRLRQRSHGNASDN
jgi:hypothetical protein